MKRERGFTLLELIVVVAVISILAAAVSPAVLQQLLQGRIDATREEARALSTAIIGTGDGSNFGFVGDIGRLPSSLHELVQGGSLPPYSVRTIRSIGMGWRGPYINAGFSAADSLTDAWGHAYTGGVTGQVRSAGPDGVVNTADDIVYPPAAPAIAGSVIVTVKTTASGKTLVDPVGFAVELYFASDGAQAAVTDTQAPFSFTNVPMGVHAVRVIKAATGDVVAQDTVVVRPRGTAVAELWF